MHAHAIAQVDAEGTGVHLMWAGPRPWVYSPRGWFIQRRVARRPRRDLVCDELTQDRIDRLRVERVTRLALGEYTFRVARGPVPLEPIAGTGPIGGGEWEVFTLELDDPRPHVRVDATAKFSFAFALREGKVVATASGPSTGPVSHQFSAFGIDVVVLYALGLSSGRFCVGHPRQPEEWREEPFIVRELQLPLRELMPGLATADDEFAEASSRLLPGEVLDREEFERLAETLRPMVANAGPPRPLDLLLLLREDLAADFEELAALDPIRVLLAHPKWRRVLGFGWFDRDPSLVVGETYEFRITGFFPAADLADLVYGFHTVPSQTALPAEFYLHDLRVRLPQPARVERAPSTPTTGTAQVSRRGVRLKPQDQFFWLVPSLTGWSVVIDFPSPVGAVVLELDAGHDLRYSAGDPDDLFLTLTPVPPGPRPHLDFPTPITQLRLQGDGFLHALRIPAAPAELVPVSIDLPPVSLVDAPRPDPPLFAEIANLQEFQEASTSDLPQETPPPRHALGFEVRWRPALSAGLVVWPPDEPPPPLDAALYQVEHREAGTDDWTPVLTEENWMLGDRDEALDETAPFPGADLMLLFPEVRQPGPGLDVFWRDVFDFAEGDGVVRRAVPDPGTSHQYRVRAVDPAGRPSLTWRETGVARLEKRVPPPTPVGPTERPADEMDLPEPVGVHARVIVRDAPDLTAGDLDLLGTDDNLIVLRWGWHQQQRELDPFAREFRVYVADLPLDGVPGQLTATTEIGPGRHQVTLQLTRAVVADAAKGLRLSAGHPFRIETHTGGSAVTAVLEALTPGPGGGLPVPVPGPVLLPLRLTPDLTRAKAWSERVEVVPITAATAYEAVIRNRLTLTADHPRDTIWIGVSAADDQFYVPDPLAPAGTRPGNEGAIVPVACVGRYWGRPEFDIPPALDPVPVVIGPEPLDRPSRIELDLAPFLGGSGLGSGDLVRPERAAADDVFAAYFTTPDGRVMARAIDPTSASEVDVEVTIPNPGDRAAVLAALDSGSVDALDDRFVVFLAGSHPYRDRLFTPVGAAPVPHARFVDLLPAKAARYVYRVRRSDAAGHLSAGGAVAGVVVRVPSLAAPAAPERLVRESADAPGMLRLSVPADPELTHLLTFTQVTGNGRLLQGGELLRIPNRPDLYPHAGVRFRTPDGDLLDAQVKALTDPDVTVDPAGFRNFVVSVAAGPGERVRVWACSLSRDGVPSRLMGPWGFAMPLPPLPAPTLSVSGVPPTLDFTWSWPVGPRHTAALQRSPDGVAWTRVSPLLAESVTSFAYTPPPGSWRYRLLVMAADGRAEPSNVVEP